MRLIYHGGLRACAAMFCIAALAFGATRAAACDLCAIYTGSLMQQDKTGLFLGVAEQYSDFATIRAGGARVPNTNDEWVHSSITQLVGGYSFARWAGLQVNVPLVSREYRRIEDGIATRGDTGGLGDISLFARATPLSRSLGEWLLHVELLAGLKVPTGNSDRLAEELDEHSDDMHPSRVARHGDEGGESAVHGHDLAVGSGSVDGIFGTSANLSWRKYFVQAALQYIVRGNGDFGYEYADDVTWEAAPGVYVLTDDRYTGALRVVTSGEHKGLDEQHGHAADDTGVTAAYVGPGVMFTWKDDLHADLTVDIPVLQDVTGRQIVPDYRLRGGLVWRF